MIKITVDTSNATESEVTELNKIIPFGEKQFHFDKNNIEVNFITKRDAEIIMDNIGTKVFLKADVETLEKTLVYDPKGCSEINKRIVDLARDLVQ